MVHLEELHSHHHSEHYLLVEEPDLELVDYFEQGYYLLVEEQVNETETYGIGVEYGEERVDVPDITPSQKGVSVLLDTMIRGTVTPVTLRDVAEDWLLA